MVYLYLFIVSFFPSDMVHDIHMSKTKIKYVQESDSWQISMRVFIDDLEDVVNERTKVDLKLFSDKENSQADTLLSEYLNEKLVLMIDGEDQKAKWVGKEISEDLEAIWCYLEIESLPLKSNVKVDNNLLQEKFSDQNNIVIVELPNRKKDYFIFFPARELESIDLN